MLHVPPMPARVPASASARHAPRPTDGVMMMPPIAVARLLSTSTTTSASSHLYGRPSRLYKTAVTLHHSLQVTTKSCNHFNLYGRPSDLYTSTAQTARKSSTSLVLRSRGFASSSDQAGAVICMESR